MPPSLSRVISVLSLCLLAAPPAFAGSLIEQQRPAFLRAEQALKQGRLAEADELIKDLADYPLLPWLLYLKLSKDLDNGPAVLDFLNRHGQDRQAGLLRKRWLERLAGQEAWAEYAQNYREADSPGLQCHYYLALANLGRREEAFAGAGKLWLTGASLPASCERLFNLWRADPGFSPERIWPRFALAMRQGNLALATALQSQMPEDLRGQAEFWRLVHGNPRLVLSCSAWNPADPRAGQIFAHGIDRLAGEAPLLAQTAWALHKNRFAMTGEEAARLDRRLGLALAAQRLPQAAAYLLDAPLANLDAQARGWRVRAALAGQDWAMALAAIESLPAEEKNQAQWRYWRARGLEALGDPQAALAEYRLAAKERDFYGFNAADRIGADYSLASQTAPIGKADLDRLAGSPPFQIVSEWLALGRENEARSEWMHATQSLSLQDLVVAAKLAQRWQLDNLAISTAAKAGYWNDLPLRFPLGYAGQIAESAQAQQLDPSWVYAVVRRESAFDPNIGSPVGALGLMQLMPATGALMARQLGETLPGNNALLDPGRNLRYGSAYLRGLLDRFDQRFALAVAAYNAGPHRVERWLPAGGMPADLWVETIPFSETRQYVAAVLSYAVVYQSRLGQPVRRVGDLLPQLPSADKAQAQEDRPISVPFCE